MASEQQMQITDTPLVATDTQDPESLPKVVKTKRTVRFNDTVDKEATHSKYEYDRRQSVPTYDAIKKSGGTGSREALKVRQEMVDFKQYEMDVHGDSQNNTGWSLGTARKSVRARLAQMKEEAEYDFMEEVCEASVDMDSTNKHKDEQPTDPELEEWEIDLEESFYDQM